MAMDTKRAEEMNEGRAETAAGEMLHDGKERHEAGKPPREEAVDGDAELHAISEQQATTQRGWYECGPFEKPENER
jgi:hypothetical protein